MTEKSRWSTAYVVFGSWSPECQEVNIDMYIDIWIVLINPVCEPQKICINIVDQNDLYAFAMDFLSCILFSHIMLIFIFYVNSYVSIHL